MNKILLSVASLALIGVISFGATRAFFSDTEVSAGNSFVAGSVDIEITGISDDYRDDGISNPHPKPIFTPSNTNGFSFELADLKPLDFGAITYGLSNNTNDAHVCAKVVETGNAENGRIGPEIAAGDETGPEVGVGLGFGELQNFMSFKFNNQSGLLNDIDGQWFNVGQILSGDDEEFKIGYCFGEYVGNNCVANTVGNVNTAQTDSMFADVSFYAVQTRNNPNFNCASLNGAGAPFETNDSSDQARVVGQTDSNNPLGSERSISTHYDDDFTLNIKEVGSNMVFTINTPFDVGVGSDPNDSVALLIDADNNGTANFQFEYKGNPAGWNYQVVDSGPSWQPLAVLPAGQSASENSSKDEFIITIPSADLGTTFRVAVNATDNGSPVSNTHVGMSIPTSSDIFNVSGHSSWTSSANYKVVVR